MDARGQLRLWWGSRKNQDSRTPSYREYLKSHSVIPVPIARQTQGWGLDGQAPRILTTALRKWWSASLRSQVTNGKTGIQTLRCLIPKLALLSHCCWGRTWGGRAAGLPALEVGSMLPFCRRSRFLRWVSLAESGSWASPWDILDLDSWLWPDWLVQSGTLSLPGVMHQMLSGMKNHVNMSFRDTPQARSQSRGRWEGREALSSVLPKPVCGRTHLGIPPVWVIGPLPTSILTCPTRLLLQRCRAPRPLRCPAWRSLAPLLDLGGLALRPRSRCLTQEHGFLLSLTVLDIHHTSWFRTAQRPLSCWQSVALPDLFPSGVCEQLNLPAHWEDANPHPPSLCVLPLLLTLPKELPSAWTALRDHFPCKTKIHSL